MIEILVNMDAMISGAEHEEVTKKLSELNLKKEGTRRTYPDEVLWEIWRG